MGDCGNKCEVYSRIVGYFRPVQNWNAGKTEEFAQRLEYDETKTMSHDVNVEQPVVCKTC